MLDISQIDDKFPFPEMRDGQRECIEFILNSFNSGKRIVIVEGPTGSGKSVIGITVANYFDKAYYLTPQKILQSQIMRDFVDEGASELKGKATYKCTYWHRMNSKSIPLPKHIIEQEQYMDRDCTEGYCRLYNNNNTGCCGAGDSSHCPYLNKVYQTINAHIAVMNFSSFLYQTAYTGRFQTRDLLIVDECHNIETALLDFIQLSISDKLLKRIGLSLPQLPNLVDYLEYFDSNDLSGRLETLKANAVAKKDYKEVDEVESISIKYARLMECIQDGDEWVVEYRQNRFGSQIEIKPIFVKGYTEHCLLKFGIKILLMSATVLNVNLLCTSLGLDRSTVSAYKMTSRFPVEHRPIYMIPTARMVGGKDKQHVWGPKMVSAVDKIISKYKGKRGIIHTHNFAIAKMLMDDCKNKRRFLYQENFDNKDDMLLSHAASVDGIIVAPAMHEGLDLHGDLSRFQILCKTPWPNFFESKQLARRNELDPQYIPWLVALKLVQSVGRSVRSEDDYADTYVIDDTFKEFIKQHKNLIPTWFLDAIKTHK